MILLLRFCFAAILVLMTWGTIRASLDQALFDIPSEVTGNPWFQVTLLDAYFAFFTAYVWIAWREQSLGARILWLITVMLWGNFALATYLLIALFRIPTDGSLSAVFTTRQPGKLLVPSVFVAIGVVVYLLGAKNVLFA